MYTCGESGGGGRFNFYRTFGVEFRGNIKKVLSFYVSAVGGAERAPEYAAEKMLSDPHGYVSGEAYSRGIVPKYLSSKTELTGLTLVAMSYKCT